MPAAHKKGKTSKNKRHFQKSHAIQLKIKCKIQQLPGLLLFSPNYW